MQRQLVQLLKIEVTSSREAGTRAGPEAGLSPGRWERGGVPGRSPTTKVLNLQCACVWVGVIPLASVRPHPQLQ